MNAPVRRAITVSDQELAARYAGGCVIVIDDDAEILAALKSLIEMEGYACETYNSAGAYLHILNSDTPCFPGPRCVLCDMKMPEIDGLELQTRLAELDGTPLIFMSGGSSTQDAISAFRGGALDFLIKPMDATALLSAVAKALRVNADRRQSTERKAVIATRISSLTERERSVARRVSQGQTNLSIASELGIALRTVKLHRQRAMEKVGVRRVADLVRVADEGGL